MAKILIVEDNQGTNKAICEYMKEAGHTLFSPTIYLWVAPRHPAVLLSNLLPKL